MSETGVTQALRAVIEADQAPLSPPAEAMARAIRARHGAAVRALVFYGSALREGDDAGKMLDFYVIVSRYRAVYGAGAKSLGAWLLPPNVHFLAITDAAGRPLRSKYAIISEAAFIRRAGGGTLESMFWARFTQPARIVTDDAALRARLIDTLAWHIATHPSVTDRRLGVAERLAATAIERATGPAASILDTLARVLSEQGRTDDAIIAQRAAVERAESDDLRRRFATRLDELTAEGGGG